MKSQHPHQQQTPELLSAWHIGLDRLSDREIEAALKRYIETPRTTEFFPTLGEFLRHAHEGWIPRILKNCLVRGAGCTFPLRTLGLHRVA
ncbi:MAG: hypothetical protein VXC58_18140 [Deltaproteobacteria bacterium]